MMRGVTEPVGPVMLPLKSAMSTARPSINAVGCPIRITTVVGLPSECVPVKVTELSDASQLRPAPTHKANTPFEIMDADLPPPSGTSLYGDSTFTRELFPSIPGREGVFTFVLNGAGLLLVSGGVGVGVGASGVGVGAGVAVMVSLPSVSSWTRLNLASKVLFDVAVKV